ELIAPWYQHRDVELTCASQRDAVDEDLGITRFTRYEQARVTTRQLDLRRRESCNHRRQLPCSHLGGSGVERRAYHVACSAEVGIYDYQVDGVRVDGRSRQHGDLT